MNEMAAIEYKRILREWSVRDLCDMADADPASYRDYVRGKLLPPFKVLKRLMEALDLRLFITDIEVTKDFDASTWTLVSMFIKSNPEETYLCYSKITTIRLTTDEVFYDMLKMALFITFFYRSFGKIPPDEACARQFRGMGLSNVLTLKKICAQEDLLTPDLFPTTRSQMILDQLVKDIQKYLVTANMMDDIHGE